MNNNGTQQKLKLMGGDAQLDNVTKIINAGRF
jgi:hypothetical protein